jgi:hypothetical protein
MSDKFEHEVNPDKIKRAEIVVCIPSYSEADSISYPIIQANNGLMKYFNNKSFSAPQQRSRRSISLHLRALKARGTISRTSSKRWLTSMQRRSWS